jgi:hypothetical protein
MYEMDFPYIWRNGIQGKLYQPILTHNQVKNNYIILRKWQLFNPSILQIVPKRLFSLRLLWHE